MPNPIIVDSFTSTLYGSTGVAVNLSNNVTSGLPITDATIVKYPSYGGTATVTYGTLGPNSVGITYAPSYAGTYSTGPDSIIYYVTNSSGNSNTATIFTYLSGVPELIPTVDETNVDTGVALPTATGQNVLLPMVMGNEYTLKFAASNVSSWQSQVTSSTNLPSWLTIDPSNPTQQFIGMPTVVGTYDFSVTVSNMYTLPRLSTTTNYSISVALPTIQLTVSSPVIEGGPVYVTWSINYYRASVVNVYNGSGTFNLADQPVLYGMGSFTAPSNLDFDTLTVELWNTTPSTMVTSTSTYYYATETLQPVSTPLPGSSYSQTSEFWNKAPNKVSLRDDWDQWGLYRSYLGSTIPGWGSDSIQNTPGTVSIPYSGQNVDIIVVGRGAPDPNHPEFLDSKGNTRVKYYDWFQWTSELTAFIDAAQVPAKYADGSYHSESANEACAVASIAAGNRYGWAREANIYSFDFSRIYGDLPGFSVTDDYGYLMAFGYIGIFHNNKPINPVTGFRNPTVVVCVSLKPAVINISDLTSVTYRGTTYTSGFTTATLATYNLNVPFNDNKLYFTTHQPGTISSDAMVQNCIGAGVIVVTGAGDFSNYVDVAGGQDFNNSVVTNIDSTYYYNQGFPVTPNDGVVCVAAADSTVVEKPAPTSGGGPRVDIFAPGNDLMASINSKLGVYNYQLGANGPILEDPRSSLYYLSKVSGSSYAAAQVAGFLACYAQLRPSITPFEAKQYVTAIAGVNQLNTSTNTSVGSSTSVQLRSSTNGAYCSFLNTYGVWKADDLNPAQGVTTFVFTFNSLSPDAASTLAISADNYMQLTLNGTSYDTQNLSFYGQTNFTVSIIKGINTLVCNVNNFGGPASLGILITDSFNNQVFATSPNLSLVSATTTVTGSPNLYLFGAFPANVSEKVTSVPAVATGQIFNLYITGGAASGAFDYLIDGVYAGNGLLTRDGTATIAGQSFATAGAKVYEFIFINTTRVIAHTVNVIKHNASVLESSFTQTSPHWNKTPEHANPETYWLNWGLFRSTIPTNAPGWGSDSPTVDVSGTASIPYTGLNVDIVVIDEGSVVPDHPEFALYSDGTGGSRVKYCNWFKYNSDILGVPNDIYNDRNYYGYQESNKATAIAGITAGNTYGWARAAHIYSLNYNLIIPFNSTTYIATAFDYVTAFHNSKTVNPVTGFVNPTLIIAGWATHAKLNVSDIGQVTYHGVDTFDPTANQLPGFNIFAPYSNIGNNSIYVNYRDDAVDASVASAIAAGVVIVSTPGDFSSYIALDSSDPEWDNRILTNGGVGIMYFYNRGTSPGAVDGVICVGSLDSTVEQQKALYSGNGPRVDVFAPGNDQISAEANPYGIYTDIAGFYSPVSKDPRDSNYVIGKSVGTAYAAANVAGYAACLLQIYPYLPSSGIWALITDYSAVDELVDDQVGFGVNNGLNGAPNRLLQSYFPVFDEQMYTTVNGSTTTAVVVGDNFSIHIENADPITHFYYSGSGSGSGTIGSDGTFVIDTVALKNSGIYVYNFYFASTNHYRTLTFHVLTTTLLSNQNIIYANDYNRIQNRISYLNSVVYGHGLQSSQVSAGNKALKTDWSKVYSDIVSAYIHQHGTIATMPILNINPINPVKVTAAEINSMTMVIDDLINNFDTIGTGQSSAYNTYNINTTTTAVYDSYVQVYDWSGNSQPLAARNFFNLGGRIELSFENPKLGQQTGAFTLTDYLNSSGTISLPIKGGYVNTKFRVDSVNGNVITVDSVVAPDMGKTAVATGTVIIRSSIGTAGGIAAPNPYVSIYSVVQGQLNVSPVQIVSLYGNEVTTATFTISNTYGSVINVTAINVIPDPSRKPLSIKVNKTFPFAVTGTNVTVSVTLQNVEPGGRAGIYENTFVVESDGPNPELIFPVLAETNFGIVATLDPLVLSKSTATTFTVVPYAGTLSNYIGQIATSSTGFLMVNPGIGFTGFPFDNPTARLTMSLYIYNQVYRGSRTPNSSIRTTSKVPTLITDVGSIPNLTTSTQVEIIAYSNNNDVATTLVDIEMPIKSYDKHLGHWLSPQNMLNGVIGFSYDIIDGQRALTVGFGMGGGGSSPLYVLDRVFSGSSISNQSYGLFSNYAIQQLGRKFYTPISTSTVSAGIGAWNTGTSNTSTYNTYTEITIYTPEALATEFASTSSSDTTLNGNSISGPNYWTYVFDSIPNPDNTYATYTTTSTNNPFLSVYGVWNGANSSATTYASTSSFLVRDGGDFTYYFSQGAIPGGNSIESSFSVGGNIVNITGSDQIFKGSIPITAGLHDITVISTQTGGVNSIAAVGLAIVDYDGYVVWCTLDPMVPTWAEIGRVFLIDDGRPHSYQIIPNVFSMNIANGTTYSSYFANESIVTVNDNGLGQLSIALNSLVSLSYDSITDATLANIPYLFYYHSDAENQTKGNKRFNNYQASSDYVKYFTGFDPYGKTTTAMRLSPGYIAPPTMFTEYYNESAKKKKPLWEQVLIDVVEIGVIAVAAVYGIFALGIALSVAALSGASLTIAAFTTWVTSGSIIETIFQIGLALCFITTAVCKDDDKPDDCYELETLRKFRDEYMLTNPEYSKLVEEYYETAPAIVASINNRLDREEIYEMFLVDYITPAIKAIENGDNKLAFDIYCSLYYHAKSLAEK